MRCRAYLQTHLVFSEQVNARVIKSLAFQKFFRIPKIKAIFVLLFKFSTFGIDGIHRSFYVNALSRNELVKRAARKKTMSGVALSLPDFQLKRLAIRWLQEDIPSMDLSNFFLSNDITTAYIYLKNSVENRIFCSVQKLIIVRDACVEPLLSMPFLKN